jgi:hypothetical protein
VAWSFETLGNASIQIAREDQPVLVTDPWLSGTAYFGSWALEQPLTARQTERMLASPFAWFSHGHPDHLHVPSAERLDRKTEILLPDHYYPEMRDWFAGKGFRTRVLRFKQWTELTPGLRVMCLQNENLDATLMIEAGGALIINKNDAPLCGEDRFFRQLVRRYRKTFLLSLCAFDADMLNTYDADMQPTMGAPQQRKPGTVWAVSRLCDMLDVRYFCCSSSQHVYVRPDSAWANPFRIASRDMRRYWCARRTELIEPFVTVNLDDCSYVRNRPAEREPTRFPVIEPDDDWTERMSWQDWAALEAFMRKFALLRRHQDFVAFTVAGERRIIWLRPLAGPNPRDARGVNFIVPRRSLMATVRDGYFDDLLIGNFMKAQLFNMTLYPHFTPIVGKLGGGAKVYTDAERRRFRRHFFRLSPAAYVTYRWQQAAQYRLVPAIKATARALGAFDALKRLRWRLIGAPRPQ